MWFILGWNLPQDPLAPLKPNNYMISHQKQQLKILVGSCLPHEQLKIKNTYLNSWTSLSRFPFFHLHKWTHFAEGHTPLRSRLRSMLRLSSICLASFGKGPSCHRNVNEASRVAFLLISQKEHDWGRYNKCLSQVSGYYIKPYKSLSGPFFILSYHHIIYIYIYHIWIKMNS